MKDAMQKFGWNYEDANMWVEIIKELEILDATVEVMRAAFTEVSEGEGRNRKREEEEYRYWIDGHTVMDIGVNGQLSKRRVIRRKHLRYGRQFIIDRD